MAKDKIKEVLLIFKTHLDIGFTDYSKNIVDKYINEYIPASVKLGYELKNTDTPFIWTVGSWLIYEALKKDDGTLKKAIEDNIITWHGMPFTTHTECMSEKLLDYGISLSKKLDEKFGHKTIAAKLSDVPGHTIGIVSHLAKAGIEFLHIGVNGATPKPDVPDLFRWKCENDSIIVMYKAGEYGGYTEIGDFCIAFGHTNDNKGPQTAEQIREFYAQIRERYPDAVIKASTLDDAAKKLRCVDMPVIENEIGDTWIHGIGTDPLKVSMYRDVLRAIENKDIDGYNFDEDLLLVPEHTWGFDLKKSFKNATDYYPEDFDKLTAERQKIEKSWEEQREYVISAAKKLNIVCENQNGAVIPDFDGMRQCDNYDFGIELSWQLFDNGDYKRYRKQYMQLDVDWAIWDFTKVGLPDYKGGTYYATAKEVWVDDDNITALFEFDGEISNRWGLPKFYVVEKQGRVEITMVGKKATRVPQAIWLKFKGFNENWNLRKLGQWINPDNIIDSKLVTACDGYIKNDDYEIYSYDAPLVCPYGRHLLEYNIGKCDRDMYFNLYNNIWNTNFPMWYGDDIKYRFDIKTLKKEKNN